MKISIFFDSRTGTTREAAHRMRAAFCDEGHDCQALAVQEVRPETIDSSDLICVGSWTQGLFVVGQHPTRETMEFIDRLGSLDGRRAIVFCTYKLATGALLPTMADALEAKGADVVGRFQFRGPEPDGAFRSFATRVDEQRSKVIFAEREKTLLRRWRERSMGTTTLTWDLQEQDPKKVELLYRVWSRIYDRSVQLDPAYASGLRRMVRLSVRPGDRLLDVGCGTGLGTLAAAKVASRVVGVDMSPHMLRLLRSKIRRQRVRNVDVIEGRFPDALPRGSDFDSVISSFAIVHLPAEDRRALYASVHGCLRPGGRLGLFSAQGEVAERFETAEALVADLDAVGFERITIRDVKDVYRIVTARRHPKSHGDGPR